MAGSARRRFGDAVEEAFAAEVEFAVHDGRGGAEGVFETVDGQDGVFAVVAEDDGCSVATGDVDAAGGADGRRKDEIVDALQPERFAARLASHRVKAGENVLIVPQEIERVVVHQRRGDVGRQAVEFPGDVVGAAEVAFGAGQPDGDHRLRIVAVPGNHQAAVVHGRGDDVVG